MPASGQGSPPTFTAAEIRRIGAFGPWPPAPPRDPSNNVSGSAVAIDFGEQLFFEQSLSAHNNLSCASCHEPNRQWTDGKTLGIGRRTLDRNTTSLWNVGLQRWFGWDGSNDSLWAQSLRPILEPTEFASDAAAIAGKMRSSVDMSCRYRRVFGRTPQTQADEVVLVDVAKSLAAFQETLVTARTPFDDFRDALLSGDLQAMSRYPAPAQRGLAIFVGKGSCATCHFGPTFSNGEFADTGVPFFLDRGGVDPGRHGGIRKLQSSPFNLLGKYNDDPQRRSATSTRHVELRHNNWGEFKVPGLRNVAESGPYMHNGSLATLEDVVRHYSELDEDRLHADGERILKRLDLTPGESSDLVAFLRSLSDGRKWQPSTAAQETCR